ncbi:MAG: CfrBI family restriction endonuclease [Bacteroidia bacterium]|nr:CfrBI family restriction endonuclease [Bacteroidia bacterium]MDW8302997.1 CfrBI family restriction endonuclease [Bacteroidia bacterium]
MTLTEQVTKNIISRLIKSQDYRIEIIALINAHFLEFAIQFFEKIVQAKIRNKNVIDWYKREFLNPNLSADEIAIHSGLNRKTITNMFNSATKQIVIDASNQHYELLHSSISYLLDNQEDIDLNLTIKFRGVSVDLNINESLIVINTLAVKRAALRGGLWSTAGKKVEKPLMQTLCMLFDVPKDYYVVQLNRRVEKSSILNFEREVDFYLICNGKKYKCEVKLMGKGNPESADAVVARNSKILVADKLSTLNKTQLNQLNINWIELRSQNGYQKFEKILRDLGIPHKTFVGDLDSRLNEIFSMIF